jgi:hypothetical protein
MTVNRSKWPPMVRMGLWGIPNRIIAWMFVQLAVALAVAGLFLGLQDPRFFAGVAFVFAALWYYRAIRWVDHHDQWQ